MVCIRGHRGAHRYFAAFSRGPWVSPGLSLCPGFCPAGAHHKSRCPSGAPHRPALNRLSAFSIALTLLNRFGPVVPRVGPGPWNARGSIPGRGPRGPEAFIILFFRKNSTLCRFIALTPYHLFDCFAVLLLCGLSERGPTVVRPWALGPVNRVRGPPVRALGPPWGGASAPRGWRSPRVTPWDKPPGPRAATVPNPPGL